MTVKRYYEDAYRSTFTTTINELAQDEKGRWYAILEETCFYPTGGGQPHDTGMLGGRRVLEVENVNGEIRHYLDAPLEEGVTINGNIDWDRRFDHMQQHAGQHILSASFIESLGYETISFHLGQETLTIDLEIPDLTREEADRAEALANQVIREARPIETKWVTEGELGDYPLRKQPDVDGPIRLVIIPDFDYNGCGGTHPASTSEVGGIKILDWEKHKSHIRLRFICGDRIRTHLQAKHDLLRDLTGIVQAPEEGMKEAVLRMMTKQKEVEKELDVMKGDYLKLEAEVMIKGVQEKTGHPMISRVYDDRPIKELHGLAQEIISRHDGVLVLFIAKNGSKLQLVGAKGEASTVGLKESVRPVLALINGKGGGKDSFVQGGGEVLISKEDLMDEWVKQF
ncbi:DHHA1 domain-containing protein [Rossellomorea marisflavi]|uniref:alanyl-tRNA editing protein n=1 Tax=Rossellomorea marisflavi TaxID=189381 RepID=UPI0034598FC8